MTAYFEMFPKQVIALARPVKRASASTLSISYKTEQL